MTNSLCSLYSMPGRAAPTSGQLTMQPVLYAWESSTNKWPTHYAACTLCLGEQHQQVANSLCSLYSMPGRAAPTSDQLTMQPVLYAWESSTNKWPTHYAACTLCLGEQHQQVTNSLCSLYSMPGRAAPTSGIKRKELRYHAELVSSLT